MAVLLNLRAKCSLYTLKPASSSCFLPVEWCVRPLPQAMNVEKYAVFTAAKLGVGKLQHQAAP